MTKSGFQLSGQLKSSILSLAFVFAFPVYTLADVVLVFDGSEATRLMTTRYSNQGIAGQFTVSHEVELSQIGMTLAPSENGNIRFVVFEDAVLLHFSESVPLVRDDVHEVLSPIFSITLEPDKTYFIGAISDVEADYGCCGEGGTQGVFTSVGRNTNPTGFYVPELGEPGNTHVDVNLYVGQPE